MKKNSMFLWMAVLLMIWLWGCGSGPDTQSGGDSKTETQQKAEDQLEKAMRLRNEDDKRLVTGSNNRITTESIEAVFQPQVITGIGEINDAKLSEPGRVYYFKLRAIYKGHDAKAKRILLQDIGEQSSIGDAAFGTAFGIDTNVYPMQYRGGEIGNVLSPISEFPEEANAVATFYIMATRLTEVNGKRGNISEIGVRFIRNIEKPSLDPSKFIVANGMHYITVNDAHATTQEDVMAHYFTGGATSNTSVFDPIVYPLVDLMDARIAMDKKDLRDGYTFPTVEVKYVSEVIFKGQSNTTITVSTDDNVLTERMNFTGRASSVKNGEKVRVYYTIAKDSRVPIERWEIQAIEQH